MSDHALRDPRRLICWTGHLVYCPQRMEQWNNQKVLNSELPQPPFASVLHHKMDVQNRTVGPSCPGRHSMILTQKKDQDCTLGQAHSSAVTRTFSSHRLCCPHISLMVNEMSMSSLVQIQSVLRKFPLVNQVIQLKSPFLSSC